MSLRVPPPTALDTYNLIVTTTPKKLAPTLFAVHINSRTATDQWLYLFQGSAIPANATVPLIAPIYVPANFVGYIEVPNAAADGLVVSTNSVLTSGASAGLVLAASSSATSFTVNVAAKLDITAWVEEYEARIYPTELNKTQVGSLFVVIDPLMIVWAEGDGPYGVRKIEVKKTTNTAKYLCMYAVDTPSASTAIIWWAYLAATGVATQGYEFTFGQGKGLSPFEQRKVAGVNLNYSACTLVEQVNLTPGNGIAVPTLQVLVTYANY